MWKKIKKALLAGILAFLAAGFLECLNGGMDPERGGPGILAVQAAVTGSIQVNYSCSGGEEPIAGAEFSCERIADAAVDGGNISYVMKEPYGRADYNPNAADYGSDTEMAEKYLKLYRKYADHTAEVGTTASGGTCRFSGCVPGLYLIWQSDSEGDAENFEISSPLVVSVPTYENGQFIYTAAVYPKTSKKPVSDRPKKTGKPLDVLKAKNMKTPEQAEEDQEKAVSLGWQPIPEVQPEADYIDAGGDPSQLRKGGATGDEGHALLWLGVAGASLGGMILALILLRRRRRNRYGTLRRS